jgi:hypothetical protein
MADSLVGDRTIRCPGRSVNSRPKGSPRARCVVRADQTTGPLVTLKMTDETSEGVPSDGTARHAGLNRAAADAGSNKLRARAVGRQRPCHVG